MSEHIRATFAQCRSEKRSALVAFLTVGFPTADATLPLLHALQDGGADIVELGMPFSDPIADGPVIQEANNKSLANGVTLTKCLETVRAARADGIRIPLMLMGYYNPIQHFGEEQFVREAHDAGANGFLVVDLPPEEAARFRSTCTHYGLSYIPLVAPSTPDDRLRDLTAGADSFVYVVSRMGTTGHAQSVAANTDELLKKVRQFAGENIPLALGFGVSTREHFVALEKDADGVVIGSRIIQLVGDEEDPTVRCQKLKEYVNNVVGGRTVDVSKIPTLAVQKIAESMASLNGAKNPAAAVARDRFGEFGGQYVPEALFKCLYQTEETWNAVKHEDAFWAEFKSYYPYMGRPSTLYFADKLTEVMGGAKIWLKREDLNHTGSHKINNALGQVLLAKRMGKSRVIAETGAGQHGVATATVAAKFGLKCTVYMGAEDARRQALNVFRMKLLGADVVEVNSGTRTLRDACSEALRVWVTCLDDTHYVFGTASGPHPFPEMVRTFQSVIGRETREQFSAQTGREFPDAVVACVGGGSNCSGMFSEFVPHKSVRLLGVEAGGHGTKLGENAASLTYGKIGVLHGSRGYVLQTADGQIVDTESISAGLDYPGVGPELCHWKATGRAEFVACANKDAIRGFRLLSQTEGIIPALESSHAVIKGAERAAEMKPDEHLVICLSGRGDKDVAHVAALLPEYGPQIGWDLRFEGNAGPA